MANSVTSSSSIGRCSVNGLRIVCNAFAAGSYLHIRGYPAEQKCNDAVRDADLLKRFWEASEELTGVHYLD